MALGRITTKYGPKVWGRLAGWYNPFTIQYPPGVDCILTSDEEILLDQWGGGGSDSESLTSTTGEMKTVIGIYYPSYYTGPIPNWTEAEIREKLSDEIEEAISNFSDGNTTLVGPNGGQVMIDGPRQLVGDSPNAFQSYFSPCNNHTSTGTLGVARARMQSVCPTCDVRHAILPACPRLSLQPPGNIGSLAGTAGGCISCPGTLGIDSLTWFDGMAGYTGTTTTGGGCAQAPGADPGTYIPEDDIEILTVGRIRQVVLHEILHTLNWPHTNKPLVGGQWCPTFFAQNGPQLPCTDAAGNYRGMDNLGSMAFSGGCSNPYNAYNNHPSASTKYIRGMGLSPNDDGIWLPDNAVLSLDLWPHPSEDNVRTVRLYAHDTSTRAKKDTLRDLTTGASSDALIVDPTTGEGVVPYLIKIKRPVDGTQSSDNYPVNDRFIFISYRHNAWYTRKNEWDPNTGSNPGDAGWIQGGYHNGAVVMDWGPVDVDDKPGVLSLYKYDAEDVRSPSDGPNQILEGYTANGTAYPKLELKIIENIGSAGDTGPPSIVVQIQAL